MARRIGRFSLEMIVVAGALILLKEWFFPLIISLWFPDPLMAETMREWTAVLSGTIFLLSQLGFGSSGRQAHRLSLAEASVAFWGLHLTMRWFPDLSSAWRNLAADLAAPFFPDTGFGIYELMAACFLLHLIGRAVRIAEHEERQDPLPVKLKKKMDSS
jgi:hypothetical protein